MTKANAARCVAAMLAFLPLPAARASIPTAHCRGGDKTESGLQGLTTPAEIASGAAAIGFNCNMDIVGQYQGEGASWQLTAWKNCAYFDQKSGTGFVVYDISQDCLHPVQKAFINIPGMFGHTGQWAPDGNTYYVTPLRTDQTLLAVDTKDPANPALIPCAAGSYGCGTNGFFTAPSADFVTARWHDLEFSKDGNTAYINLLGPGATAAANG